MGDIAHKLEESIEKLIAAGCVIIVCAARAATRRTKPTVTARALEELAQTHGFRLEWIKKTKRRTIFLQPIRK